MANSFNHTILPAWPVDAATPVYPWLHGGKWEGEGMKESPDPLHGWRWEEPLIADPEASLQVYALEPVAWHGGPEPGNLPSEPQTSLLVTGPCELMWDFGVESAGWIEFESEDLCGDVEVSISEYNQPAAVNMGAEHPCKTARPQRVEGTATWRLRLNAAHYEGVRFAWLHVRTCPQAWSFRNLRLVCQVKPANYVGSFECADPLLTKIWHAGAYAVKLNLLQDHFGAILMERSDRHSWTGDALISQAVALAAFGNYAFVRQNTRRMQDDANGIESYSLYWILALLDDVMHSGDAGEFKAQLPRVKAKLAHALEVVEKNLPLAFCGHDDRTGSGFEEPEIAGNRVFFLYLAGRTARAVSDALAWIGGCEETESLCARLTNPPAAPSSAGLHAGTEALLGGFIEDVAGFAAASYSDPLTRVSYSPFNGYFVLEGLAAAGLHREALDLVRRCWGTMLDLGATTFWESFRPEWAAFLQPNDPPPDGPHGYTSLCHPWSSGPTRWLSDHVLGIRPLTPGFATFGVRSSSCGIAWSRGSVPTPHGVIQIERDATKIRLVIPEGTTARIEDGTGRTLAAGAHEIKISESEPGHLPENFREPAARWLKDSPWVPSSDGLAGWIAFAANPDGSSLACLPEGVRVDMREHKAQGHPRRCHFGETGMDFPLACDGMPPGALRTSCPHVVSQSFAFDVHSRIPCTLASAAGTSIRKGFARQSKSSILKVWTSPHPPVWSSASPRGSFFGSPASARCASASTISPAPTRPSMACSSERTNKRGSEPAHPDYGVPGATTSTAHGESGGISTSVRAPRATTLAWVSLAKDA